MEELLLLCPWDRGSQARPRSGAAGGVWAARGLQGGGTQQDGSGGRGPGGKELLGVPGVAPAPGPAARAPPPQQTVCLPTRPPPSGPRGSRRGRWPPCRPRWPISTRLAAPVSGWRNQSLLALQVCLELPCPPSVSLDSPALSRLISGSCCCRQKKLASERKRR